MSPERERPRARRARASPFHGPWLLIGGVVLVVAAAWLEGPVVARHVVEVVSLRRVESHAAVLHEASRESGIDPCMLAAVMYVESRGKVDAVSGAGALGLLQLMPAAASDAARKLKLPPPSREALLSDARLNVRLGANHLAWLSRSLGYEPERTLVAYNAGRQRLIDWEKAAGGWDAWRAKQIEDGDSATLKYAQNVIALSQRFRERGVIAAAAPEARGAAERAGASGGAAGLAENAAPRDSAEDPSRR